MLNLTTNVIKKLGGKRCRWYGHVKRMENGRLPSLLKNWQTDGRNGRGRSKKRCRDNLGEELERYGPREIEADDREQ